MRNFYIEQSSNRYTVNGDVDGLGAGAVQRGATTARTTAAASSARGRGSSSATRSNAWYNAQIAAGKTPAADQRLPRAVRRLGSLRLRRRRQLQRAGRLHRPLPVVHAGEGEETGGGAQGTDAIWSHRWYAFYTDIGVRPAPACNKLGGVQIGGIELLDRRLHVEPENGGVGVFAHEFGHDLGLPDLYDTSRQHRRRRELDRLLDAHVAAARTAARASRRRHRHRSRST